MIEWSRVCIQRPSEGDLLSLPRPRSKASCTCLREPLLSQVELHDYFCRHSGCQGTEKAPCGELIPNREFGTRKRILTKAERKERSGERYLKPRTELLERF